MKRTKIKCEKCNDEISKSNYKKHISVCNGNGKYVPLLNCPYCNLDFSTQNFNIGNHVRWCNYSINNINWKEIQKAHDAGVYWNNLIKMFSISRKTLNSAEKLGFLKKILHKAKHSEETKKILSDKRKKFLQENIDKHVWKRNNKFKSEPCEYFKKILTENSIYFIEEYSPLENYSFSIDIAFPDKKIGIEINGNQHYNSDKTLKEYYQKRHNIIESADWKLFEIHYSSVYKKEFINTLIKKLKTDFNLGEIDYSFYFKKSKIKKICMCGVEIGYKSKCCVKCANLNSRHVERPPLEQLLEDIKKLGYCGTGRKYGVSDTAIRKWIKNYKKMDNNL